MGHGSSKASYKGLQHQMTKQKYTVKTEKKRENRGGSKMISSGGVGEVGEGGVVNLIRSPYVTYSDT